MQQFDRRSLLQGGAAVALATAASGTDAVAQAGVVQRRNVSGMALNDPILVSYRTAIAAMKNLPPSDPRNWTRQAQIHLNFCPHRNWYFLPWHRAYLVAFERLCRQLSGNPNFALPYWDWTANPQLPSAFATPTYNGQPNQLFNATRSSQTVTIPANVAGPARISTILAETSFEVFASTRPPGQNSTAPSWQRANGTEGPLESGPHDQVHVRISGDMATFMSPLDPIFWLHHCNIDRLWDRWNNLGHANTSDNLWRTFAFNGQFVNPSGASGTTPYNTTVAGVLNIVSLGYRYVAPLFNTVLANQVMAKQIDLSKPLQMSQFNVTSAAKINAALEMPVQLAAAQSQSLLKAMQPLALTAAAPNRPMQAPSRVIATIRDIDPPKQGNAEVRVFIDCPYLTPDTPVEDRHYAGSFTFFGLGHAEHGGTHSVAIDITETVQKLRNSASDMSKQINVQLMPVAIPGVPPAGDFKPGSVEVAIF